MVESLCHEKSPNAVSIIQLVFLMQVIFLYHQLCLFDSKDSIVNPKNTCMYN